MKTWLLQTIYPQSSLTVSIVMVPWHTYTNHSDAVQLLDDEPFHVLKPTIELLLDNKEKDKQRAAAELLAGVIGGT